MPVFAKSRPASPALSHPIADWRGGRFNPKALEIGEDEVLGLIGDGIAAGVFSETFIPDLSAILQDARDER